MTTIDTVRSLLGDVLQLGERAKSLNAGSPLLGSVPELDSIAVVGVIAALEEHFGITVDDDEIDASTFTSVGSLADFVDRKLAG